MEKWKDIVGYEGYYQVSSYGRVRSLDRNVLHPTGSIMLRKGLLLKVGSTPNGYSVVSLNKLGDRKYISVHRLVAIAFLPAQPKELPQINHIDGNKKNNHFLNIEWSNSSLNQLHAIRNGLVKYWKNQSGKIHFNKWATQK